MNIFKKWKSKLGTQGVTKYGFIFSVIGSLIASIIFSLVETFLANRQNYFENILENINSINFLLFFMLITLLILTLSIFTQVYRREIYPKLARANTAEHCGIEYVTFLGETQTLKIDESNDETRSILEKQILYSKIVNSAENGDEITILAASGASIFGEKGTILGDNLRSIKQRINVYLLDPGSSAKAAKARAKQLNMDQNEYRNQIIKSIEYLRELAKEKEYIDLKLYLYDFLPQFGIIKSDQLMWVFYFSMSSQGKPSTIFTLNKSNQSDYPKKLHCFLSEYLSNLCHSSRGNDQPINKSVCLVENINEWKIPHDLKGNSFDSEISARKETSFAIYIQKLIMKDYQHERKIPYSIESRVFIEDVIPVIKKIQET